MICRLNIGHFKKGRVIALSFCLLFLAGCASYQKQVFDARYRLVMRQPGLAAKALEPMAKKESDDQLVFLLDYGIALHEQQDFKMSNRALLAADQLVDFKDYISLSREGGSFLLSEGLVQYKGDPFEKVLINAYLAINFLMLGDLEASAVEVRKLNQRLNFLRDEGEPEFVQSVFARYLGAMIWEEERNWDNAYIDYFKAHQIFPDFHYFKEDLVRAAYRARRREDLKKWQKKFPDVKVDRKKWKTQGELVVIYQQGWIPRKRPRPENPRFPKMFPVRTTTQFAGINIDNSRSGQTKPLFSIGRVAMKTIEDEFASLVARRLVGIAAKAVVANQIGKQNKALGQLAWAAMNAADQADTRQWSTLPETVQIYKVWLKPGTYTVSFDGLNVYGKKSGESSTPVKVRIRPGKKTFMTWRSFR